MKFSFRPVEGAFYDLFTQAANNLVKGTELLNELALPGVDVQSVSDRLTDVEHDSDQITHDLYKKINSTFITRSRGMASAVILACWSSTSTSSCISRGSDGSSVSPYR